MPFFLCCAGYIAECCTKVHTSCCQIEASSKTVAAQRFRLLLESDGKDCDETPVVLKLPFKSPHPAMTLVIVKGEGDKKYACLDVEAKIGVERGLFDHVGKDTYAFTKPDQDWDETMEAIRG